MLARLPRNNKLHPAIATIPLPVLVQADLDIESYSAAAAPASKEKRTRAFSELSPMVPRFPVLLFLGIWRAGASLWRARASGLCRVSSPIAGCAVRLSQRKSGAGHRIGWCLGFACRGVSRNRRRRSDSSDSRDSDSPLSGFPPHIPSIIGAGEVGPGLEKNKGKGASLLEWDEEAVGGRQRAIELSMEKSVGGVQAVS